MPGDIWKFSDQIDDFDIAMLRRDFITCQQGMRYYNIGEKPFIRLAHEAGAVYKIGKAVRINKNILEVSMRKFECIPQKGVKFIWKER